MKTEHTPIPWTRAITPRLEAKYITEPYPCVRVLGASGGLVAEVRAAGGPRTEAEANAAFILEAVNSHAALTARVAELERLAQAVLDWDGGNAALLRETAAAVMGKA